MLKPYGYQKEALEAIGRARGEGREKALVVMASGLGKTLTAGFDILKFFETKPDAKILYLCHDGRILNQAKRKFKELFGESYSYALYDGTSKLGRPTDFLFATFQIMKDHRKELSREQFDYVVVDESHHAAAKTYFPTIRYFRPSFMLALTATPERMDGEDIRKIFGEAVFKLGLVEAWMRNLLSPVDYRMVLDDFVGLELYLDKDLGRISLKELNRTFFAPKRDEEIVRLIKEYSKARENPTTFIFCKTIKHAKEIAKIYGTEAAIVYYGQNPLVNEAILEKFRAGEIRTVISVGMLNEGIDVPRADVVVFLRDTSSDTIFLQQLGRGLRLSPDKEDVLVLDFVANFERMAYLFEIAGELENAVRVTVGTAGGGKIGGDVRKVFNLSVATPKFREKIVNLKALIESARSRFWTEEEMLEALRRLARELGRIPTHKDIKECPYCPQPVTYKYRFGSMEHALELAGLQPTWKGRKLWTDEGALEALRRLAAELGRNPSCKEIDACNYCPSVHVYKRKFGSVSHAFELAGLQPTWRSKKKWTVEEALGAFRRLTKELGKVPTCKEVHNCNYCPSLTVIEKEFGSLNRALELAGIKPIRKSRRTWTDEEMLEALRKLAEELGRVPRVTEINNCDYCPRARIYEARFGSVDRALELAGLQPVKSFHQKSWTDEEMLEALRRLTKELGRVPWGNEIDGCKYCPQVRTYKRRFGSLERAIELAGLQSMLKPQKIWTDEEMLEALQRLAKELGRNPMKKEIDKCDYCPSSALYSKRFGSVGKALEAAGLR